MITMSPARGLLQECMGAFRRAEVTGRPFAGQAGPLLPYSSLSSSELRALPVQH